MIKFSGEKLFQRIPNETFERSSNKETNMRQKPSYAAKTLVQSWLGKSTAFLKASFAYSFCGRQYGRYTYQPTSF